MKLAGIVLSLIISFWSILSFFIWAKARPKFALSMEEDDIQFRGISSTQYKIRVKNEGERKAEKIKINCITEDTFGKVKEVKEQEFWCDDNGVNFKKPQKLAPEGEIALHFTGEASELQGRYSNISNIICKATYSECFVWKLYLPYCSCVDLNDKQKHPRCWNLWRCWKCPYRQCKNSCVRNKIGGDNG